MADLLIREKAFRKLNEQLDNEFQRTTTAITTAASKTKTNTTLNKIEQNGRERSIPLNFEDNEKIIKKTNMINNERYATYTKTKGQSSSIIYKSGGGDYISPQKSPIFKNRKENNVKNITKTVSPLRDEFVNSNTYRKNRKSRGSDDPKRGKSTITAMKVVNNGRKNANSDTPIVVKYHNDKFTSSPSLDNLIKDTVEDADDFDGNTINGKSSRHFSSNLLDIQNADGRHITKMVNTNGIIRFLKSKIALLEESQARSIQDMAQQKEAFEEISERHKLAKQQRDKAMQKNSSLSEQVEKLTNQLNEVSRRSRDQTQESIEKHKELETVKRELKQLSITHKNLEVRFARIQEELETALKSQESLKNNERELREKSRHQIDAKESEIKFLKKQRNDLFTAYKKQLYLIDNLKQQNLCMEQAKMIDFSEKEFSKVLEWNLRT